LGIIEEKGSHFSFYAIWICTQKPGNMKEIHIGQLIEQELRNQERSVSWFARMLCCERTNVYSIFRRKSIDCSMLYRISIILDKNFFNPYCIKLKEDRNKSTDKA
jgi:hypothetical protein